MLNIHVRGTALFGIKENKGVVGIDTELGTLSLYDYLTNKLVKAKILIKN